MVAENKKNTALEGNTPSVSPPGEGGPISSGRGNFLRRPSKKNFTYGCLVLGALIVVAVGIGLLTDKIHIGPKVYAQAAGHKIYKKEVDSLKGDAKDISDRQAATVLADKYLSEAMAKQYGIQITNEDRQAINSTQYSEYARQLQINQLYFNRLQTQNEGLYKGELIVANFSRYVAYQSPLLSEQKAMDSNIGNPAAIAADKQYAQSFITNLYNEIHAGKITFSQAEQIEQNDPRVGEAVYPTLPHSGAFDTSDPNQIRNGLIQTASIKQQVHDIKSGATSKPFVVKVPNSTTNDSTAESYFLIARMNSSSGGNSNMSFSQELAQAKKQYGYKVNV